MQESDRQKQPGVDEPHENCDNCSAIARLEDLMFAQIDADTIELMKIAEHMARK